MVPPCQAAEGGVDLGGAGRRVCLKYCVIVELCANEWRHDESLSLSHGRVITLAGPDLVLLVIGKNLNRVILAVGLQVGGLVGNRVLAAQLVLNLREGVGNVLDFEREKRAASGFVGKMFQHLVALELLSAGV